MFQLRLWESEIGLPQRGEKTKIGEIYEDGKFVSGMILRNDGEYFIDTNFVSYAVNEGRPEKPVDVVVIREVARALFRFIERNKDRFSRIPPAA